MHKIDAIHTGSWNVSGTCEANGVERRTSLLHVFCFIHRCVV